MAVHMEKTTVFHGLSCNTHGAKGLIGYFVKMLNNEQCFTSKWLIELYRLKFILSL